MRKIFSALVFASLISAGLAHAQTAVIKTTAGDITVRLFPDKAPETVANFVGLAKGTKTWKDPRDNQEKKNKPLYNGTIFHRTIKGFMIQGGDPLGKGYGGPGYTFKDEIDPSLTFSKPYLLAMANSGPSTNGSQFFITTGTPMHLNGHHTIFGEVTKGSDVVDKIGNAETNEQARPLKPTVIKSIQIKD